MISHVHSALYILHVLCCTYMALKVGGVCTVLTHSASRTPCKMIVNEDSMQFKDTGETLVKGIKLRLCKLLGNNFRHLSS